MLSPCAVKAMEVEVPLLASVGIRIGAIGAVAKVLQIYA